jgi:hypothetical protein
MTCCGGSGNNQFRQELADGQWADEEMHSPATAAALMRHGSTGGGSGNKKSAAADSGDANADADESGAINILPWDSSINLSVHQPLYPPGRMIHLVRHYPKPNTTAEQ